MKIIMMMIMTATSLMFMSRDEEFNPDKGFFTLSTSLLMNAIVSATGFYPTKGKQVVLVGRRSCLHFDHRRKIQIVS